MAYTGSTALLDALAEAGVAYIFANFGSDHPPIVEALAESRAIGRKVPEVITCPNEMVALSAAHGYAQATGHAQAVLVHVECGTQALAGAMHNAAKGRVPVLILAGTSPFTQEGELPGSRNEFIQWIQDVFDQRGLVRGYVRYDNELRSGRNVKQIVHRALQFAHSEPRGPTYLMAAREVLEEVVPPVAVNAAAWPAIAPTALPPEAVAELANDLVTARLPLIVTSYLGRNPMAVAELMALCRRLAIGVLESVPNYMNFPTDDPLYQGNQWNEPVQNTALAEADLVLVLDSDVPWIPLVSRPAPDARVVHIDTDPLKQQMPLWQSPATRVFRADVATALRQINAALDAGCPAPDRFGSRRAHWEDRHRDWRAELDAREQPDGDTITPEFLTTRLRAHLGPDSIVLSEGISNYKTIVDHLRCNQPGGLYTSGGGSLGWNGGAAIGMKLAHPGRLVAALCGDGSYMFSVPATVHWMARRYGTPFLHVVYNNRGWKSPKLSALAVHPDGFASRANDIGVTFDPPPDYAGIAVAAGGAFGRTVHRAADLDAAIEAALRAVRAEGRAAVLDVWLPHL